MYVVPLLCIIVLCRTEVCVLCCDCETPVLLSALCFVHVCRVVAHIVVCADTIPQKLATTNLVNVTKRPIPGVLMWNWSIECKIPNLPRACARPICLLLLMSVFFDIIVCTVFAWCLAPALHSVPPSLYFWLNVCGFFVECMWEEFVRATAHFQGGVCTLLLRIWHVNLFMHATPKFSWRCTYVVLREVPLIIFVPHSYSLQDVSAGRFFWPLVPPGGYSAIPLGGIH